MTSYLEIGRTVDYHNNEIQYNICEERVDENISSLVGIYPLVDRFVIPDSLDFLEGSQLLGSIKACFESMKYEEGFLDVDMIFPFRGNNDLERTGLGAYLLSRTFEVFYEDSLKDDIEITPESVIGIESGISSLQGILKGRGFGPSELNNNLLVNTIYDSAIQSQFKLIEKGWF